MKAKDTRHMIMLMQSASQKSIRNMSKVFGKSHQWIYERMKVNKFSLQEWHDICDFLGFDFELRLKDRNSDLVITWDGNTTD